MEKQNITIKGFKCFADNTLELNKITLLTGANASGKSSVVQAILLLKDASESNDLTSLLSLDDQRYAFDFGSADSLINNELKSDEVEIGLSDDIVMLFRGNEQEQSRKLLVHIKGLDALHAFFQKGLTYFTAERQGPRYEYDRNASSGGNCGCHGENVGNVMADKWNARVAGNRLLVEKEKEEFFNIALDDWVDYIFPGVTIRVQPRGTQSYQILIRERYHNIQTDSTNIGFGISYALPVLVGGLLAEEDSWLVVENPEAHLHAKAQSNIGYFLGMMADAGLRVVVETHSEHIVNGIRRAALVSGRLKSEDVNIYFFKNKSEIELITMDEHGNLSDFPVDFFDQSRQDMLEIIKNNA